MIKTMKCFLLFTAMLMGVQAKTQVIEIQEKARPLSEVLNILSEKYEIQYSASGEKTIDCQVTLQKRFKNPDAAMKTLLDICNLTFIKINEVYVIQNILEAKEPLSRSFTGTVIDSETGEPIQYVVIGTENGRFLSDQKGKFSLSSLAERINIKAKHLAYASIDTTINHKNVHILKMSPQEFALDDVVILSQESEQIFSDKYEISRAYKEGRLKPGYYQTYDQFILNQPGIEWSNPKIKKKKPWVMYGGPVTVYKLNIDQEQTKSIGDIVGFCDGENIYFLFGHTELLGKDKFSKVSFAGPFVIHFGIDVNSNNSNIDPGGMIMPSTSRNTQVLNMESGLHSRINKRHLKTIIQSDEVLLKAYKKEFQKERKIGEYLFKFVRGTD